MSRIRISLINGRKKIRSHICREYHTEFLFIMPAERFIVLLVRQLAGELINLHNFFMKFIGESLKREYVKQKYCSQFPFGWPVVKRENYVWLREILCTTHIMMPVLIISLSVALVQWT